MAGPLELHVVSCPDFESCGAPAMVSRVRL